MSLDFSAQEFIQDFLLEADEHLQEVDSRLLALEENLPRRGPEASLTRDEHIAALLRIYHTLKGLSGMIGLSPAASISHALESVLKRVQRVELDLSSEVIDAMLTGSRALRDWVETLRRPDHPAPDPETVIAQLEALGAQEAHPADDMLADMDFVAAADAPEPEPEPEPEPGSQPAPRPSPVSDLPAAPLPPEVRRELSPQEQQKLTLALRAGKQVFLTTFSPSHEKNARGINVNLVRQQLERAGTLIKAIPRIQGGRVSFLFLLACETAPNPDDFPAMDWQRVQPDEPRPDRRPAQSRLQLSQPVDEHLSLRVELSRLNDAMHLVGKLVIARARLEEQIGGLPPGPARDQLETTLDALEHALRDLRETVMQMRMVPISEIFARVPLIVRDICRASGKQVSLNIVGQNTEIDKILAEKLTDPLLHLVRNALTHGIETPEARQRAGKTAHGTLTLRGETRGDNVLIHVEDDGAGVDLDRILHKARALGWLPPERESLTEEEALQLICRPGFSTRDSADMGAGRGVGMDVVLRTVQSLGGSLSMHTRPGQGTTFTLRLPLTLAILDAFLIRSGGHTFAVPKNSIQRIIRVPTAEITHTTGLQLLRQGQDYLRLTDLNQALSLPDSPQEIRHGLVIDRDALLCDHVLGLQEIVILPIYDPLIAIPGLLGAAELGDGQLVLIFDPETLLKRGLDV